MTAARELPPDPRGRNTAMNKTTPLILLTAAALVWACDDGESSPRSRNFTVTIANVATARPFVSGGVFNTPTGDAQPGPATPGKKYEFTFDAGRKQKLSFVTMLAATNDLFFGPDGEGIALYDANGDPITADVTDQILLWDAGTEVNEEPKVGPNTVSKQSGPDTGVDENGNVVTIDDATDGVSFAYPAPNEVMKVTVTHMTGTEFKVSIENVSTDMALMTSEGDFAAPLSPGVWVLHNGSDPLFTEGMPDRGQGLEHIAEDGNPTMLGAYVADNTGITYPASPGAWVVHSASTMPLFTDGAADYGDGVEHIAEDGNPTMLGSNLTSLAGYVAGAVFNMPVGASGPGPILPGSSYSFSFEATDGDALSFVTMLAATNDAFFAPEDGGIALFDSAGEPVTGDVTSQIVLWDAGTEANERPGVGPNTVTNQLAPDTGDPGEGKVQPIREVGDGFTYPAVSDVLKVTVTAN
ncbi:MAG: spondin domain-containing protein [Deltaproteobacteria bacterium]|nr:spondin domain-containing protein [Deltaproteobacteria bacterium]